VTGMRRTVEKVNIFTQQLEKCVGLLLVDHVPLLPEYLWNNTFKNHNDLGFFYADTELQCGMANPVYALAELESLRNTSWQCERWVRRELRDIEEIPLEERWKASGVRHFFGRRRMVLPLDERALGNIRSFFDTANLKSDDVAFWILRDMMGQVKILGEMLTALRLKSRSGFSAHDMTESSAIMKMLAFQYELTGFKYRVGLDHKTGKMKWGKL